MGNIKLLIGAGCVRLLAAEMLVVGDLMVEKVAWAEFFWIRQDCSMPQNFLCECNQPKARAEKMDLNLVQ